MNEEKWLCVCIPCLKDLFWVDPAGSWIDFSGELRTVADVAALQRSIIGSKYSTSYWYQDEMQWEIVSKGSQPKPLFPDVQIEYLLNIHAGDAINLVQHYRDMPKGSSCDRYNFRIWWQHAFQVEDSAMNHVENLTPNLIFVNRHHYRWSLYNIGSVVDYVEMLKVDAFQNTFSRAKIQFLCTLDEATTVEMMRNASKMNLDEGFSIPVARANSLDGVIKVVSRLHDHGNLRLFEIIRALAIDTKDHPLGSGDS